MEHQAIHRYLPSTESLRHCRRGSSWGSSRSPYSVRRLRTAVAGHGSSARGRRRHTMLLEMKMPRRRTFARKFEIMPMRVMHAVAELKAVLDLQ